MRWNLQLHLFEVLVNEIGFVQCEFQRQSVFVQQQHRCKNERTRSESHHDSSTLERDKNECEVEPLCCLFFHRKSLGRIFTVHSLSGHFLLLPKQRDNVLRHTMRVARERRSRSSLNSDLPYRRCVVVLGILCALAFIYLSLSDDHIIDPQQIDTKSDRELLQQHPKDRPFKPTRRQNPSGGAFVHTGKTGGSTISVLLRNGCHSFMPHPCRTNISHESVASKLVQSYYHVPDFGLLKESNHSFYIITSRDPFDRTISAFVYDHIKNRNARNETIDDIKQSKYKEAYRCFPSLQHFVEYLGDKPHEFNYPHKRNWVTAESCPDLAKAALHSRVKIYNHLYFSLFFILSTTPTLEKQTLYTIRQEYLWNDWKALNMVLGQTEDVYIPHDGTNFLRNVTLLEQEKKMPVTRALNQHGRVTLCNALREEYRAYFYILIHAQNLSPGDLQQSIERTKHNCPTLDLPYSTYTK